jgi:hypothetical protein
VHPRRSPRAPRRRAPALASRLSLAHNSSLFASSGVATLLDDGRGDGTTAEFVHNLRDWAGALPYSLSGISRYRSPNRRFLSL